MTHSPKLTLISNNLRPWCSHSNA